MAVAQISSTTFDQNDAKYHTCCNSVHLKVAARVVSLVYLGIVACNIAFATTRGATVALYSWVSFSFSIAIFGCLVYGVFKEKRVYMLPYLCFQAASIVMFTIAIFVFIIAIAVSEKMLLSFAEDIGGINADITTNPNVVNELQAFTILFILFACAALLLQIWFFQIIYRFREFLRDRENSFSFNLEGVFQTASSVYGTSVDDLEFVSEPPDYNTLK
ncbi:hypothetical protein Tcan_11050 [Toxocara canis]|uniref:Lysosomal-associated transmembrane protein 4A n=1 Tax=Toxocara canis TaxID=6265 RepID=A0A0B2UXF8_TOXCA|nr:hypothetical protein Tcan_11050 [Toxocara canis]